MTYPTFKVGDTRPPLAGQVQNNGSGANMTNATAVLHIRRPDGTVLSVAGTWTDATTGSWAYLGGPQLAGWAVGDLNVAGTWTVEVQVTYADTGVQTFGPEPFPVDNQIA